MFIEALKSQAYSLKHQIDLVKRVFSGDLQTAKEDYERKVDLALKERNYSLTLQKEKIRDLESQIKQEKTRSFHLQQELSALNSQIANEQSSNSQRKQILLDDLKFLKEELSNLRSHIQMLQSELINIENDFEKSMNYISDRFESSYSELRSQKVNSSSKITALENEIQELKKNFGRKDSMGESDIKTLEEALRSTYHTVELQTFSIDKLRKATQESLNEAAAYLKVKNELEKKENLIRDENESLKAEIDKLERKIYGRATRK